MPIVVTRSNNNNNNDENNNNNNKNRKKVTKSFCNENKRMLGGTLTNQSNKVGMTLHT